MRGILTVLLVAGWAVSAADTASYQRALADWRTQHEAQLKADNGWLTVVGLHWLKEGANRVGSAAGYEVQLPEAAPRNLGVITVRSGKARFTLASGAAATINGKPARAGASTADLHTDAEPAPDIIATGGATGRINFFVILREDKLAVRVKDNDSATRRNFSGERWFPADPTWRIQARYVAYDKPHLLTFDTAVGVKETDPSPGYVIFKREGVEYRLEPTLEDDHFFDDHFFFVMRDATSGKTTYSASRFVYTPLPKDGPGGKTVDLDFNKAENPPCVYTDFATCPLPPPQNRLKLAITAGELVYGAHH